MINVTLIIDGTIKASYANFGYIPYGHSIVRPIINNLTPVNRLVASTTTRRTRNLAMSCPSRNSRWTLMETSRPST